ncbi:mitochondrial carrier [Gonapodya prolifera JEL478]|uniref:Mitochondrial carrier n=1 Tax=Gonapodya prolifera (strain JEL478) TaxID=1344416 RepID=A0A139AII3_GONPJ|nr:mitochondrial carrier [Gonapodya prolifera JEL478]|eukprot:KXS16621.1 mitochondrial carrier [Gonapodya prolifera JEL478]
MALRASSNAPPLPIGIPKKVSLYEEDDIFSDHPIEETDTLTFATASYARALFSSPFRVVETLTDAQYRGSNGAQRPRRGAKGKEVARDRDPAFDLFADNPWPTSEGFDEFSAQVRREPSPAPAPASTEAPAPSNGKKMSLLDGMIDSTKSIWDHPDGGWTFLLKGHLTQFVANLATDALRPALEESLNDLLDVFDETHLGTYVASHVVVATLLSPLETTRTRLILQASSTPLTYTNLPQTLFSIYQHEGGLPGLYHPITLIPTILSSVFSSSLRYASRTILSEHLHLTRLYQPVSYWAANLSLLAVESFILSPWELVVTRLRAQRNVVPIPFAPQQEDPSYETAVVVSPPGPAVRKYYGPIDVLGHVAREEGGIDGSLAVTELPPEVGLGEFVKRYLAGLMSLWRGWEARYARRAVEVVMEEVWVADSGPGELDGGW